MSTSTSSRNASPPVDDSAPHELFADAKNDVLLVSADNQSFPFRRLYLEAASEVFEDMFGAGRAEGARKRSRLGLDVIKLAEKGAVLETFLQFLHPRLGSPRLATVKMAESLCTLADKYSTPSALSAILAAADSLLSSKEAAPSLVALGLIYNNRKLVMRALKDFGDGPTPQDRKRRPPYTLNDIPVRLWRKIPQTNLWFLLNQVQAAVFDPRDSAENFGSNGLWDLLAHEESTTDLTDAELASWLLDYGIRHPDD